MQTIWKYPLKLVDRQTIEMPQGARILTAQYQEKVLCVWAEVDTIKHREKREILIQGTGPPLNSVFANRYIGTVQDDLFVWHVYEYDPTI